MIFHRFVRMDNFYYSGELENIIEIVKNRLYFGVTTDHNSISIRNTPSAYYFSIDDELLYVNYYYDFGPLNISCLYKYCTKINNFLKCSQGAKRIVHYTSNDPNKRTNAAFLMGCFAVLYLKMEPKEIYNLLIAGGSYRNFVDASQGISQFTIHLVDCFNAIHKASLLNFFNFADFNSEEYDINNRLENGDMNWLVPRKFLAFIGPTESEVNCGHKPEFYVEYFLQNDIRTVIRLNNKVYDAAVFLQAGIAHHELFFPDGTTPPKSVLLRFLQISENVAGAIAVHCKAGLGRTGSLIGAYIMKHYHMTAREAIAWMRICRPGSVIGQQHGWLEKIESWLWRQGSQYRVRHYGEGDRIPRHRYGIYSIQWSKEKQRITQVAMQRNKGWNSGPTEKRRQIQSAQSRSTRYHEFPKKKILQGPDQFKNISRILSRAIPQPIVNIRTVCSTQDEEFKRKALTTMRQNKVRSAIIKSGNGGDLKIDVQRKRDSILEKSDASQTQGDHLNHIKALRKMNSKSSYANTIHNKHLFPVQKRNVGVGC